MAISKTLRLGFTIISRIVTITFACLAIFAFFETQAILDGSSNIGDFRIVDEDKFMVPLVLCFPDEINLDNVQATGNSLECTQMDFLINACAASLLFGAVASVSYVVIDWMARNNKGPFNRSAAAGMGIFLFFILLMTGTTAGALYEQNKIWVDVYQTILDASESTSNMTAEAYGNLNLIISAASFSFIASMLNIIDLIVSSCCCVADNDQHDGDNNSATSKTVVTSKKKVAEDEAKKERKEPKRGSRVPKIPTPFPKKSKKSKGDDDEEEMHSTTEPTIEYGSSDQTRTPAQKSVHDTPSWFS